MFEGPQPVVGLTVLVLALFALGGSRRVAEIKASLEEGVREFKRTIRRM